MGFNAPFQAVFNAAAAAIKAKSSIQAVNVGEQVRVPSLPLALINPLPSPSARAAQGVIEFTINFSVVIIIRETEPANWFSDIISILADTVDAILADRSLGGAVLDVWPTSFGPGEIKFNNRLFYGGDVRFAAKLLYLPSGSSP